ncbi:MAG TPA: hypothetical protein VH877_30100 [Polyangia bacterium]|jgi:hypothetical protein|nr:hypothetical protein [Polyangia bacterium]
MPRKLTAKTPLDEMEDEVLYTDAALRADPDAARLLERTAHWLDRIDELRRVYRKVRRAEAGAHAARVVAGARLHRACVAFGDELLLAVGKDRRADRWRQFFSLPLSLFLRQELGRRVARVRGWLGTSDPVFERHRQEIERWAQAADKALIATKALAIVYGEARQAKTALARELTHERDHLHEALAALGRELGQLREWPDGFFRLDPRSVGARPPAEDPPSSPL